MKRRSFLATLVAPLVVKTIPVKQYTTPWVEMDPGVPDSVQVILLKAKPLGNTTFNEALLLHKAIFNNSLNLQLEVKEHQPWFFVGKTSVTFERRKC